MDGSYKTMTRWPASSEDFRIRCRIFMAPPPCVPPANGKSPGRASGAQMEFLVDFGWELHGSYPAEICRNGDLGWFKPQIWGYHWFQWIERSEHFRQSSILLDSTSNIGGSCRFPLTPILGGKGFHQKNERHIGVIIPTNCVYYVYMCVCVRVCTYIFMFDHYLTGCKEKACPAHPDKPGKDSLFSMTRRGGLCHPVPLDFQGLVLPEQP
jgi:hypothetical protein